MSFWVAGAVIASSAIGAVSSSKASKNAANIQKEASTDANQIIRDQYGQTQQQLQPYIDSGRPAINRQQALLGIRGDTRDERLGNQRQAFSDYSHSPGFDFRRDEIMKDVNRTASSTGQLHSGRRHAALVDRLQGLYDSEYKTYFNQLGSQSGIGLNAAQALAGVGGNAAAGQAQNVVNAGQAGAQGQLGQAQSFNSGVSDISGAVGYIGYNGGFRRPQNIPGSDLPQSGAGGYYSQPGRGW